jgi:hypothetical protein
MLVITLAKLFNFFGRLLFRPRELTLGGGFSAGSPLPAPSSAACAPRLRFAFGLLLYEAALLPFRNNCRAF